MNLPEIKLIGIAARTKNSNEVSPATAQIGPTVQRYFQDALSTKIPNRKRPGVTYSAYAEYESDFNGAYTYFIGEEVDSFEGLPEGFRSLTIPSQEYAKITTRTGPTYQVVVEAWQKIWSMTPLELGGTRRYSADFEIYDERAADSSNAVVDIYIALK